MYISVTNDGSFLSQYTTHNRDYDAYLVGKPRPWDLWAVKRLSASWGRFAFQNVMATLPIVVVHALIITATFLWGPLWLQMVYTMLGTIALGISIGILSDMRDEYIIAGLYTNMAANWLNRKNLSSRVWNAHTSLILRTLVGQVVDKRANSTADARIAMEWLEQHPECHIFIDQLLRDSWVTSTEQLLSKKPANADEETREKFALLQQKFQDTIWNTAQAILADFEAKATQQEIAQKRAVTDLLEAVETTLDEAPEANTQWQQPRTSGPVTTRANQR